MGNPAWLTGVTRRRTLPALAEHRAALTMFNDEVIPLVKTLDIKEARAIYGPDLPSPEEMLEEPVLIRREGKPYAIAISLDDYRRFQEWREKTEREAQIQAQNAAWEKERAAFYRLKPQLLQTQKGLYVAVHGGQVVDADADERSLAIRFFEKHGQVPVYIGLVSEHPPIIEMGGPELTHCAAL